MREEIEKAIAMLESLKYIYDRSEIGVGGTINVQDYHSVIKSLQALQHKGEAVGETFEHGINGALCFVKLDRDLPEGAKLYTHPQPAVPDEVVIALSRRHPEGPCGRLMIPEHEWANVKKWVKALLSAGKGGE